MNASRVTLYMTVEPSEVRQETSITTALQSCDDTDTSSEPLGFFAFFETDFTKNKKWFTKDTTAGHFNGTVKPGN